MDTEMNNCKPTYIMYMGWYERRGGVHELDETGEGGTGSHSLPQGPGYQRQQGRDHRFQ